MASTKENTKDKPNRFWLWITVLGVLIIAAMLVYSFQFNKKPSSEKLYLTYYKPYPNEIDPIAKGDSSNRSAYQLYEIGDYEEALSTFIPNLADKHARWYFAQSMLAKNDPSAARDIFSQFSQRRDKDYGTPSLWYLALIHIKEGQIEEAKKQLTQISTSNHEVYKRKALELLTKLTN